MDAARIASQFVDLALKYEWDKIDELPEDEVKVLFETVRAAGFKLKSVKSGKLKGDYLDQDSSKTGKTYPINTLCPFKVVDQEGRDHYFATGWLDCALRRVVYGARRKHEDRRQLIKVMQTEIERSVPLAPIQLTPEGDMLGESPPSPFRLGGLEHFVDHTRDDRKLGLCVGVHMHCGSQMDRRQATATQDAIICRGCHLRVHFPKKVNTYGDLRQALAVQRTPVSV